MKNRFIILLVFILASCSDNDFEFPFEGDGTKIEIYLIKDEKIETFDAFKEVDINDLESNPWLSHTDIDFYDWSSHTFYLKHEKSENNRRGRNFVLTADKKPVITGFFYSMFMSYIPPFPTIINDNSGVFYPKDIIGLNTFGFRRSDSIMSENSAFRMEMENSGLLKEGINVEIIGLERENHSTLKYTFRVTNLDTESIYILDPNKMGASRFHYYTNGISLKMGDKYYSAHDFEPTASDKIELGWYYKLSRGSSMTRTVKLNGYDSLPTGKVIATFSFPGSKIKTLGAWKKKNGRIWMGNFRAKKELTLH